MNRIVHLALKVEDLERTTEFYQKVFGFKEMDTAKVRDHTSRHLSDGVLDVALIKYDAGTAVGRVEGGGRGPLHPPLRGRGRRHQDGDEADQGVRLRDHQRPGRDPGQVPRPGRHRVRAGAEGPLQETAEPRKKPKPKR